MMALIVQERFYKSNCIASHHHLCFMIKVSDPNTHMLRHSVLAGLTRY